jgi:hypothetical protein
MRFLLWWAIAGAFVAQAQSPQDSQALIEKMRAAAVSYSQHLHDFVCKETIVRSTSTDRKKWKPLETREVEVGYIAHQEHWRLLSVNGKTENAEKYVRKGGWMPGGEFGRSLMFVFAPKEKADFRWDHEEPYGSRRGCVFQYSVSSANTTYVIQADADHVPLWHSGFVTVDCETGDILRMQMRTEPGFVKRMAMQLEIGLNLDVRYGPVAIGGQEFLLPQESVEVSPFGKTTTRVEIRFSDYRRFDSSSSIRFDDSGQ